MSLVSESANRELRAHALKQKADEEFVREARLRNLTHTAILAVRKEIEHSRSEMQSIQTESVKELLTRCLGKILGLEDVEIPTREHFIQHAALAIRAAVELYENLRPSAESADALESEAQL